MLAIFTKAMVGKCGASCSQAGKMHTSRVRHSPSVPTGLNAVCGANLTVRDLLGRWLALTISQKNKQRTHEARRTFIRIFTRRLPSACRQHRLVCPFVNHLSEILRNQSAAQRLQAVLKDVGRFMPTCALQPSQRSKSQAPQPHK